MSDNTFTLRIELGSSGMMTRQDVADKLVSVAGRLRDGRDSATIKDVNGNTVGQWQFTTELTTEQPSHSFLMDNPDDVAYEDADQRYGGNDNPYLED